MSNGTFQQCPQGHYYQGPTCPYCKSASSAGASQKTEMFIDTPGSSATQANSANDGRTVHSGDFASGYAGGNKTTIIDGQIPVEQRPVENRPTPNRTMFGDDFEEETTPGAAPAAKKEPRFGRKLVGWLVSYSNDELGQDYRLFEGRNIIGRDVDCSITVNDGKMSGKHAVLLFRANKYSLTDSQSSHGTFVNDEDIELEPRYIKDGDIIRMGNTVFKFRSSL